MHCVCLLWQADPLPLPAPTVVEANLARSRLVCALLRSTGYMLGGAKQLQLNSFSASLLIATTL